MSDNAKPLRAPIYIMFLEVNKTKMAGSYFAFFMAYQYLLDFFVDSIYSWG